MSCYKGDSFADVQRNLDRFPFYNGNLLWWDCGFEFKDLKSLKTCLQDPKFQKLEILNLGESHQLTNEDISPLMDAIEFLKEKLPKLNTVILFNYQLSEWVVHCALKQRPNLSDITFKVSLYDIR